MGSAAPHQACRTQAIHRPSFWNQGARYRAITTAIPGHGHPKDAVIIAQVYNATATNAFANGHGPDGLADEERQRPPPAQGHGRVQEQRRKQ